MTVEVPNGISLTSERNSNLRQRAAGIVEPLAAKLYEFGISADGVSCIGAGIVGATCVLTALRERYSQGENRTFLNRLPSAFLFLLGNGFDAIDGTVARIEKANGAVKDPLHGDLLDNAVDRSGEGATGIMKMYLAHLRGNTAGEKAAFARMVTNPLTSFTRALSELNGKQVSEDGNDSKDGGNRLFLLLQGAAGFIGTRGGRVVSDTAVILHPDLQLVADTVGTAANLFTAGKRTLGALKHSEEPEVSEEIRRNALHRIKFLGAVTLITWAAAGVTWTLLNKDGGKNAGV